MHEVGVDLIVTPYRGKAIESPWWRTAPNPLYREAETFARARDAVARLKGDQYLRRAEDSPDDTRADRAVREVDLALRDAALAEASRVDARARARRRRGHRLHRADVALPRHPDGAARALRRAGRLLRRRRADEPAGVRRHGHGLQLLPRRRSRASTTSCSRTRRAGSSGCASSARGGRRRSSGAPIPSCSTRTTSRRSTTSSSTATATSSGASGWQTLVGEPSRRLPEVDFALGGRDFRGDIGGARVIGDVPFNVFARAISAARVNLNITRRSHATVYASSTSRPFELAASGAAIVSNPVEGIERWFEPGRELLVVVDARTRRSTPTASCSPIPRRRRSWAARARERALDEHTYVASRAARARARRSSRAGGRQPSV